MTLYLVLLMVIGSLVGVFLVAHRMWGAATSPQLGNQMGGSVQEPVDSTGRTTVRGFSEAEAIGKMALRSFQDGRRYRDGSGSKRGRDV